MSDFFGRLAARALGLAQALEPRVPYRFEHAASAVPASPPDEAEEERSAKMEGAAPRARTPFEDPSFRVGERTPPAPLRTENTLRTSAPIPQPAPAAKMSGALDESQRVVRPAEPTKMSPSESVSKPTPKPMMNPLVPAMPPANAARNPRRIAAKRDEATAGSPTEVHVVHDPGESHPVRPAKSAETSVRPASLPARKPTQSKQPSTIEIRRAVGVKADHAPPILRPKEKHQRDGARATVALDKEFRREPQEPTIKVTIGRVEVRAVMEPSKPFSMPRRPASRVISLDEYLKRHEERRR